MSEKLTVLECDYRYCGWAIDVHTKKITSHLETYQQRKATDDYQLCGVYRQTELPYELKKVTGDKYSGEEPHQAIPHAFSDLTCEAIKRGNKLLASSGYCVYAPAIVGGIQRAIGEDKKIGVIWIDAHFDNVIIEDTCEESVILVGVPLSTIMGKTMDKWRKNSCILKKAISPEYILASDGRCSDKECIRNIRRTTAIVVSEEDFDKRTVWKQKVEELSDKVDAIYLMVDVDILKADLVPAYYERHKGGHDVDTVMDNVRAVMNTDKVIAFSCFCADFDKYEDGGDTTYLNSMKVIGAGLSSWKKRPIF